MVTAVKKNVLFVAVKFAIILILVRETVKIVSVVKVFLDQFVNTWTRRLHANTPNFLESAFNFATIQSAIFVEERVPSLQKIALIPGKPVPLKIFAQSFLTTECATHNALQKIVCSTGEIAITKTIWGSVPSKITVGKPITTVIVTRVVILPNVHGMDLIAKFRKIQILQRESSI